MNRGWTEYELSPVWQKVTNILVCVILTALIGGLAVMWFTTL